MEKTYLAPERFGDHYAIIRGGDKTIGDAYGYDISYIHAKFGRLMKMYNFTAEFRARFPEFVAGYESYWNGTPGLFKTGEDVARYLIAHPDCGAQVHPYFNFIDEWADGWEAILKYLEQENSGKDDK